MNIDDMTYGQLKQIASIFSNGAEQKIDNKMTGKYVIVRCHDAGVHAGILESYNGREAVLTESRRLWYWKPANKQKYLSGNTQEYLAGAEWDITKGITISGGMQRTKYGLGDGKYLNDMSFVTNSYSYGFGAKIKVAKNASLNIAYFWTNYSHFKKEYTQTIAAGGSSISAQCSDDFTRTNKVLGVGLDIDL